MKKLALTTLALGAAYLLRNKESRQKLMRQFQGLNPNSGKQP
ncbi:hypothetical protein [Bacillus smithii]